jgi:ferrochelatase
MQRYQPKTGLLLVNLGTPDSPNPSDVRRYLREFLSDPRVIDISDAARSMLLNFVILPFRPRKSAEAYQKIWTGRGSPLLFHSQDLTHKVRKRLASENVTVELAMRYGNPSIGAALDAFRVRAVDRIVVFPLYPQYAVSSTGSTIEAVAKAVGERWITPYLQIVPPFYDHPSFIDAVAKEARPVLEQGDWQRVMFSYHGLPERHLKKGDDSGQVCLLRDDCCATIGDENRSCYRAQCVETTRLLGDALQIPAEKRVLCFQSRLGRTPWIKPYTDELLTALPKQGVKRLVVLTPAFVADCLETIEEIGMRAEQDFRAAGGESLLRVPCPNSSDRFADAVLEIAREHTRWL